MLNVGLWLYGSLWRVLWAMQDFWSRADCERCAPVDGPLWPGWWD